VKTFKRLFRYDWPLHFVLLATNWLPDNVMFLRLRGRLARPFFGRCGVNLRLGRNVTFYNPAAICLGRDVYVAQGAWFMAGAPVNVGDEVLFGPYCVVASANHSRLNGSFRFAPAIHAPVVIGRGSWLGAHVTVVAGTEVGEGALIAANSVAVDKIPAHYLAAGQPARAIKLLDDSE